MTLRGRDADLYDHVKVIGHPAIGMQPGTIFFDRARHDRIEQRALGIPSEDRLAMIATQRYVVEAIGRVNAKRAGHAPTVLPRGRIRERLSGCVGPVIQIIPA